MFKKILVASDGSEGAARALDVALRLAAASRIQLHLICVEELPWLPGSREEVIGDVQSAEERFEAVIEEARKAARRRRVRLVPHVVGGHPVQTISDFVGREKIELLVVGFMGHSALYNRLIGSTTDRLVEVAPCAVMVVK